MTLLADSSFVEGLDNLFDNFSTSKPVAMNSISRYKNLEFSENTLMKNFSSIIIFCPIFTILFIMDFILFGHEHAISIFFIPTNDEIIIEALIGLFKYIEKKLFS